MHRPWSSVPSSFLAQFGSIFQCFCLFRIPCSKFKSSIDITLGQFERIILRSLHPHRQPTFRHQTHNEFPPTEWACIPLSIALHFKHHRYIIVPPPAIRTMIAISLELRSGSNLVFLAKNPTTDFDGVVLHMERSGNSMKLRKFVPGAQAQVQRLV